MVYRMFSPPFLSKLRARLLSRGGCALFGLLLFFICGSAVQADSQSPSSPDDLFKAGATAFQAGDYAGAAKNFESVLAMAPSGDALETILFTLASTYYNQKNLTKAEEYYNRCLKEFPEGKDKTKALIALAQIQSQTGRKAAAEQTLSKASEGTGDLVGKARIARASMLSEEGKAEDALAVLRPMIAGGIKDDLTVASAMAIVEIESKQGRFDEALKILSQLQDSSDLVDNPLQLDILAVRIGDALLAKGERKQALRMYAIVRPKDVVTALQKKRIESIGKIIEDNTASLQKNPKAFMEVTAANARLRGDQQQLQSALDQFEKMPDTEVPVRLRQAKAYDELDQKWETILIWESLLYSSKDPKVREDALFSIGAAYCSLGRPDDAIPMLDRYVSEYPSGKYAFQAAYLKGAVALEAGDFVKAETVFGTLMEKGDSSALAPDMQFLLANTEFAQGSDPVSPIPSKYKEAIEDYQKYIAKYPTGKFSEECFYRIPLCHFQLGDYGKALEGFQDYMKKYPAGMFAGDAGYRIALCYQAANKYDDVLRLCDEWLKKHQGEIMQAEILSLKGDAYAAKEMPEQAAKAYRDSLKLAESDALLKYSLFEASNQFQKLNSWEDIAEMFSTFAERHPKHPAVVASVYWVSKAKIKLGQPEEAKKYLAQNILKNINDRRQDAVEMLLTQLAQTCSKRPRPPLVPRATGETSGQPAASSSTVADSAPPSAPRPSPTPLPPYDSDGDFAKYLNESNVGEGGLAKARLRFAQGQLAGFTKRQDRQKELMASIYREFPADQLSAMLLSECGQIALSRGEVDKAETFFKELMDSFPKSDLMEYAYCGMGETALARKQPAEALKWFDDAVEKANAEAKLADITYGKACALLELGKYDDAKKTFEQVAATKEWRGEVTAKALLALGELEDKRGKPDAAVQYYQRVYVAYQRYPSVVIPAYLKAADAFLKLGKPEDAAKNLNDMLSKPRLAELPLAAEARKKLDSLPLSPSGSNASRNPSGSPSSTATP
jgi:tetratricopeptide (TPR) repeat protein